jgi:AraC-like DNA-binding protein
LKVKYEEYAPHKTLHDYVKCFWILEKEYTADAPIEEVTPDACIELILNFGAPYVLQSEGGRDREMPIGFLVGLQKKPLLFRSNGTVKLVATRFYAWGALPFLAPDWQSTPHVSIAQGDEWFNLSEKLRPRIDANDYDGAVAEVEDFLIGKLMASFNLKQIQIAAQMLYREKGQFRVSELAEYCNISARQLQRQFQDVIGVSPKTLARTIRFEEIRSRLMFSPETSLTDLAYEFGYTDQAHFIRDFKEFAGKTPGEFALDMQALQTIFHDRENVVFLQSPSPDSH